MFAPQEGVGHRGDAQVEAELRAGRGTQSGADAPDPGLGDVGQRMGDLTDRILGAGDGHAPVLLAAIVLLAVLHPRLAEAGVVGPAFRQAAGDALARCGMPRTAGGIQFHHRGGMRQSGERTETGETGEAEQGMERAHGGIPEGVSNGAGGRHHWAMWCLMKSFWRAASSPIQRSSLGTGLCPRWGWAMIVLRVVRLLKAA